MLGYVGYVVVGLVVLAVLAPRTWAAFRKYLAAKDVTTAEALESADPLAYYKLQVQNGVEEIGKAKQGLENCAALVRSVERQVESCKSEKSRLENRIQAALDSGDPNDTATGYAEQLAHVEEQLAVNTEQLQKHRETYSNFSRQVELGQRRVSDARNKSRSLGLQLEQSEREKEMSKFATTFDPNSLNTDGLAAAEEKIRQRIDANRAAGDVARDLSKQGLAEAADDELARKANAQKILDRFRKKETV